MRAAKRVALALLGAFCLQLASGAWISRDNIAPDAVDETKLPDAEQAHELMERARAYQTVQSYDWAQKEIINALAKAPDNLPLREEATKLWRDIEQARQSHTETATPGQKRKNLAELDEASRLAAEGKTSEAAAKASQVLAATNDPELLAKAQTILAENYPTLWGLMKAALRDFFGLMKWVFTAVGVVLILAILYNLLRWARKRISASAGKKKRPWRLGVIDDKTGSNVADFVIGAFDRWRAEQSAASSGLLRLETLRLPEVAAIEEAQRPEFDLGAALEALQLQIGTVNVGSVARFLGALREWMHPLQPSITGAAFSLNSQIVVHLVRRSANGKSALVTATADATAPQKAAEAASYKMYYLIAKETTPSDSDLANKLREGLEQLSHYISGREPKQLQTAYETFRAVVQEKPTYDEACLYEGVALDLLERHDEAVSRFRYLADHAEDDELKRKAKYNEAVSLFRKYNPGDLEDAISKLDEIIGAGSPETLADDPIKALAYSAKANAIAHKFLFWQAIIYQEVTKIPAEIEIRRVESRGDVEKWRVNIYGLIATLEEVDETTKARAKSKPAGSNDKGVNPWDPLTLRQLQWAIQNAKGNANLNLAISFYSQPDPNPDAQSRSESLKKALKAFQQCEVLLPPGVETLTNLATTLLHLSKFGQARNYAERAIELNPNYEYAYYRLAQTWIDENRKEEAVKVLNSFPKAPQISDFKEFFNRYHVEPKSA